MAELKAKIVSEFDSSQVESGVARTKRSMQDFVKTTESLGKRSEDSFKKVGDGADGAAKKTDKAHASMRRSLEQTIARMEAAGDKAKELELRMQMRGIDASSFSGYLTKIRQLQKAQTELGKSGEMSAAAMTAALRGVPAQMTDIIVSLQGGQRPLTVLLQQGGQLKDMFGGVGAAFRAVGGYALGMVNPVTVSAAAVAALAVAYNSGANEAQAFGKSLALNNDQIGLSRSQLIDLAAAVANLSSSGNLGRAAEVMNAIAANGKTGTDAIKEMGLAITDLSGVTEKSIGDMVGEYESLAKAPYEASLKLQESYNHLNAATLEHIKALEDQGKKTDAATVAQKALAASQIEAAGRVKANLGNLERAWLGVTDAAKKAWDSMLGIGREQTLLQKVQRQIAIVQNTTAEYSKSPYHANLYKKTLENQTAELNSLTEKLKLETANNKAMTERNKLQSDGVAAVAALTAVNERGLSKQQQMNKALSEYRANIETLRKANPGSALLDPKQIAAGEAAIREQYKERAKASASGAKAAETESQRIAGLITQEKELIARIRERGVQADKLTEGEKIAIRIQEELTGKLSGKARAQKEVSLAAAQELAELQKVRIAEEERAKAIAESEKVMLKAIDAQLKGADAYRAQTQSIRDQIDALGLSKVATAEAALKRDMAEFERAADSASFDPTYINAWLAKLKEGQAAVEAMKTLEFREAAYSADELQRSLELGVKYAKEDLDLVFLTSDQREKVVALREIERDLAEQIYKIDKMSISESEKQTLKDKYAINARLKLEQTASRQIRDEWQKTADTINESLTDALLRGFEDGKGFAENFRDTLKNMINTLVLKPVISFVVQPIGNIVSTLINGALGSLTNGVLGNGSTLGSLVNNASSAYSAISGNNPVLNAIGNYLGWGNTLGAGQGVLAAGSPGAAGAWTGLGAGQGVLASGAPGAAGAYTGGTAGMWGSLGTAAWIAAPVAVGLWGMSSMPDRPDYSGYASASSDPTRDRAPMTASGTIFDLTEGIIPDRDSLIAAMVNSGITDRLGYRVGPEERIRAGDRGEVWSAAGQAGVTGADVGRLSNRDLYGMLAGTTGQFYTGAGYVDPGSMWRDGMEGVRDWTYSAEMTQWGRQVAEGVLTSIETLASQFNLGGDFSVIAGMRDEAKRDLIYAGLRISQGDETLIDYEGKVGKGGTQEALRQYAAQTLEAFKKLDLPEWARALVEQTQTAINELDGEELGDQLGQTALTAVDQLNASLAQTVAILTRLGKTVLEFGGYSHDVIYQITQLLGGVDQFGTAYSAYVQTFYSEQEQMDLLHRQLQEQFGALGVAMPASIEGFRQLVESLDLNEEASRGLFASLLQISPQFAQFAQALDQTGSAAEDAAKAMEEALAAARKNTDGSFAAYRANQQKIIDQWTDVQTAAQETADEVRGIFDLLHDSVRELRGEVASTRAMQADQANEYISAALEAARATGVMPEYDGLSDAISGARAGLSSSRYSNRQDFERDQLILANRLEELEGYADEQLTTAEKHLRIAKEQIELINIDIEMQQMQIDEMRLSNTWLGTISELTNAIYEEMTKKNKGSASGAPGKPSNGVTFGPGDGFGAEHGGGPGSMWPEYATREEAAAEASRINSAGGYAYFYNVGGAWRVIDHKPVNGAGSYDRMEELRDSLNTVGSAEEWWSNAAAVGATKDELAAALNVAPDDLREWVKENLPGYQWGAGSASLEKIPSYDVGTPFVPADGIAMIHKGERIITAADNQMLIELINNMFAPRPDKTLIEVMQTGFSAMIENVIKMKNQLRYGVITTDPLPSSQDAIKSPCA